MCIFYNICIYYTSLSILLYDSYCIFKSTAWLFPPVVPVKNCRTIPPCGNFNNHISRTFLNHSSHWFKLITCIYKNFIIYLYIPPLHCITYIIYFYTSSLLCNFEENNAAKAFLKDRISWSSDGWNTRSISPRLVISNENLSKYKTNVIS